ncbi:MAG: hypothetical protein HY650_08520 [Acidobacteria bacterium]|nr:hypothetical protein [Acidobacteriota bacterium]
MSRIPLRPASGGRKRIRFAGRLLIAAIATATALRMRMDLTPDLSMIRGVESEIREAMTNLIVNAVDAMPEGGSLTVRTHLAEIDIESAVGEGTTVRLTFPSHATAGDGPVPAATAAAVPEWIAC